VQEVARLAEEINTSLDNIGARRLHTVLERILEQISFDAPDKVRALPWLQLRRWFLL
jgi:ATP-dependent HslUV protease ATP-binding subunit HslU